MVRVYEKKIRPFEYFVEVVIELRTYEVTVQCPVCCAIETLDMTAGRPFLSRKWSFINGEFLHKCCNYPYLFDMSLYNYSWQHHPARVLRWS